MTNKKEIIAGIIIIGNEILSGRTKDLNTSALSKWLNSIGIKVVEVRAIPDIEEIIINTVNELKQKFDYVFTSGGIGPTHDDITSESVSKAFSLKYEIHKEAYKILEKYYGINDFNEGRQKMSWMPSKANLILKDTIIIIESEKKTKINFPYSMKNIDERYYGKTKITFLRLID